MARRVLPHIWWLALLFGILGACALNATQPEPLRLRAATWPGYAPFYAVAEYDMAAPTVLEISTAELAQDNYRAFAEGRVDVLATTLHSALQFHEQGTDIVIILATDYSNGADGIIARPGITQVSELRGQRVGVESGSVSHFVLLRALEQASLSEDDVEVVHTGVTEAIDAITNGRVDAAVVWEPVLTTYEQTHGLEPIFTSAAMPDEIIDVLVVHPDTVEQRRDDLINLVQGWDEALQQWRAGSEDVRATMANALNVDQSHLRQQLMTIELIDLERNSRLLDLDHSNSLRPTFNQLVDFLQATDQIQSSPPAPEALVTGRIVQAALSEEVQGE
jgi:NitT/TauT family transport system substrate-binding protein